MARFIFLSAPTVKPNDHFEGWFEEYVHPNTIFLDRNTNLSTLIHELRHAVDLGTYGSRMGNSLDLALQTYKSEAQNFRDRLEKETEPSPEIEELRKLSIEYIETASEILAWSDDLCISLAFRDQCTANEAQSKLKDYRKKFQKIYRNLTSESLSQNEPFVAALMNAMRNSKQL